MEYINPQDYNYIMNKYATNRFSRKDELFSPESGMSPDSILEGIRKNDEQYKTLPHPVRKARALEYVLKNTRIRCDERDIFPSINMIDRPIDQTLISDWSHEVFHTLIPDVERRRAQLEEDGIVTIWPDYDHSVPVWEQLFSLGFSGILKESEQIRHTRTRNSEEDAFFEGIRITYTAVIAFVDRLFSQASAIDGTEQMAKALRTIRDGAPQTFYDALLLSYLYFMISEHIDALQVRSLSNFDRVFFDFYKKDLDAGVGEEELRRQLAYYMLQFTAIGNYWNQPVFLGGENADGSTLINDLSYLFLDVYDRMGIYNPKIQIKVAKSTPKAFLNKALDMIRRGHNCIVFVSDATLRKALTRVGVSEETARLCNVTGCYEYSPRGAYGTGMNYVNLLKPLEYALHCGHDGLTGKFSGIVSPPLTAYTSFDLLLDEYKHQLRALIDSIVETVNAFEDYLAYINPLSLLSATFPSCLEKGKDAIGGGALRNSSSAAFGFLGEVADSLAMIRKYVYDRKELTLGEFVEILDSNFEKNELLRMKLRADRDKYGNNRPLPDSLAKEIADFAVASTVGRTNSPVRGGTWNCGFHVARMSYTQADKTAASANGRRVGEELSKNVSASMGQNREGATAAILSATKLNATSFTGDAALDLGLLPSAVKGEDGLEAMYGLLMTFCERGGHALHINVFDANTLRDAQAHPEKYADLQIRVCGWNVLWNNIVKEEQDGFIRQAEALA